MLSLFELVNKYHRDSFLSLSLPLSLPQKQAGGGSNFTSRGLTVINRYVFHRYVTTRTAFF